MTQNLFENFTNGQLLAVNTLMDVINYEKMPNLEYKVLYRDIDFVEKQLEEELTKRGL